MNNKYSQQHPSFTLSFHRINLLARLVESFPTIFSRALRFVEFSPFCEVDFGLIGENRTTIWQLGTECRKYEA